jgi:hypothetical protein
MKLPVFLHISVPEQVQALRTYQYSLGSAATIIAECCLTGWLLFAIGCIAAIFCC